VSNNEEDNGPFLRV